MGITGKDLRVTGRHWEGIWGVLGCVFGEVWGHWELLGVHWELLEGTGSYWKGLGRDLGVSGKALGITGRYWRALGRDLGVLGGSGEVWCRDPSHLPSSVCIK